LINDRLEVGGIEEKKGSIVNQFEDRASYPIFNRPSNIQYNKEKFVMVRVLSSKELPINFNSEVVDWHYYDEENLELNNSSMLQKGMKMINLEKKPKKVSRRAIVLHIHGGGWIAMNSASHQNYTRMWANSLNIPVFSIDYRLSPEYQFPAALNDVWQTYYWLIENAESIMGLKIEKVVVVGDSAGGNLAAALTIMAIERKYRVPDGVILCYAALNVSIR